MAFDPELARLTAAAAPLIDAAYLDFVARIRSAGGADAPDFAAIWSAFTDWFHVPLDGIAPSGDDYEFYAGFIDGDPERESMEFDPPAGLAPPLAVVELGRRFSVDHPQEAATCIGLGSAGVTLHYELTDDWRALAREPHWTNANPLGWASGGSAKHRGESLACTESTIAFRLASRDYLRAEVWSARRDESVVFGPVA